MCRGAEWEAGGRGEGQSKTEKGTKTGDWNKISYQLKTGLPRKAAEPPQLARETAGMEALVTSEIGLKGRESAASDLSIGSVVTHSDTITMPVSSSQLWLPPTAFPG